MLFGRVGGREQSLMDQIFRKARARGDSVNRVPAGLFERHNVRVRRRRQNTFAGFNLPVAGVDNAHRCRYRTFHSRHQIDPLANAGVLLKETRVDQIHTAGIGNIVIDHDHFTMLTQVHTAQKDAHQVDLQGFDDFNAGITHHGGPGTTENATLPAESSISRQCTPRLAAAINDSAT